MSSGGPRPSRVTAMLDSVLYSESGIADTPLVIAGCMAIGLARYGVAIPFIWLSVWLCHSFFMVGVCGLFGIIQRAELSYYNQKLVWLGAEEPPLDYRYDPGIYWVLGIRVGFQLVGGFLGLGITVTSYL